MPVIVSLPIADRLISYRFYRDGLGFEAIGDLADDGLPEPLQFVLDGGVRLMLIPTGGFGWVIGGREVAKPGTSECLFSLAAENSVAVDQKVERARTAGAEIVSEPQSQPWGYSGVFADPDGHIWQISS
ncbi:VOC family protein [Cryptosporangium minutisporangium]|uniref:VOC family protein n=1 Tax=Cryptosporangium minutisporangium TaxID=113569 RepID=A0ABP6T4D6_9ACTN